MNERANELIKSIPDLRYDASTGMFETDRRALYDLVWLTVRECVTNIVLDTANWPGDEGQMAYYQGVQDAVKSIHKHFGVEE